jgi:ABC-type multidrug transport system ATPase subunit
MSDLSFAVEAAGLRLRTRRGPVYGPLDLTLKHGRIAVLVGPSGSGKTALLLTFAGRMSPSEGALSVLGIDALKHPAAVRARTALGLFEGLNDLPGALSIRDTVRADLALHGISPSRQRIAATSEAVGLTIDGGTIVDDLTVGDRAILGVALALTSEPGVVLVDDIDTDLSPDEQTRLWEVLHGVAETGVAVIGSCVDPACAREADVIVPMASLTASEVA